MKSDEKTVPAFREIRKHDERIYLQEDRFDTPKEYFKVICEMASDSGALHDAALALDVGCATGEFLYFLSRLKPGVRCVGIDVVPEFIARARQRVAGVEFRVGSVLEPASFPAGAADVVFAHGVLSILHDFKPGLRNILSWCRPSGYVYVFGLFNPHAVDVWTTYRRADDLNELEVETGWNCMSKASYSRFLDGEVGSGRYRFTPFELPLDLPPHKDDPLRSWTFKDAAGRRILTNALGMMQNLEVLEIRR